MLEHPQRFPGRPGGGGVSGGAGAENQAPLPGYDQVWTAPEALRYANGNTADLWLLRQGNVIVRLETTPELLEEQDLGGILTQLEDGTLKTLRKGFPYGSADRGGRRRHGSTNWADRAGGWRRYAWAFWRCLCSPGSRAPTACVRSPAPSTAGAGGVRAAVLGRGLAVDGQRTEHGHLCLPAGAHPRAPDHRPGGGAAGGGPAEAAGAGVPGRTAGPAAGGHRVELPARRAALARHSGVQPPAGVPAGPGPVRPDPGRGGGVEEAAATQAPERPGGAAAGRPVAGRYCPCGTSSALDSLSPRGWRKSWRGWTPRRRPGRWGVDAPGDMAYRQVRASVLVEGEHYSQPLMGADHTEYGSVKLDRYRCRGEGTARLLAELVRLDETRGSPGHLDGTPRPPHRRGGVRGGRLGVVRPGGGPHLPDPPLRRGGGGGGDRPERAAAGSPDLGGPRGPCWRMAVGRAG